jgi:hypothetical protein
MGLGAKRPTTIIPISKNPTKKMTEENMNTEQNHVAAGCQNKNLAICSSDIIGLKLLELLGVPAEYCRKAIIEMEAGHAIIVTAEYFARMEAEPKIDELRIEVRKFALVEQDLSGAASLYRLRDARQ